MLYIACHDEVIDTVVVTTAATIIRFGSVRYSMGSTLAHPSLICDAPPRPHREMPAYNASGPVSLRRNSVTSYFNALFAGIVAYGDRTAADPNPNSGGTSVCSVHRTLSTKVLWPNG